MSPEELDFGESNYVDDSIQTISKLKEQIETLKAALQTAIAYEIACRLFLMPLNHCSIEQKQAALSDARHHIEEYMEEGAQLARDLPEIFGDEIV